MMDLNELYLKMQTGKITRLKYFIVEKKMTVEQLSLKSGINKRTLDDYVSGRRQFKDITLEKALKIAKALEVDIQDLV